LTHLATTRPFAPGAIPTPNHTLMRGLYHKKTRNASVRFGYQQSYRSKVETGSGGTRDLRRGGAKIISLNRDPPCRKISTTKNSRRCSERVLL